MEDTVYDSEHLQAIVIASFDDDNMICYDIYCDDDRNLDYILKAAAQQATRNVAFVARIMNNPHGFYSKLCIRSCA